MADTADRLTIVAVVALVLAELPDRFRAGLGTVVVGYERSHPQRWRGSYQGVPLTDRTGGEFPSRITLYRDTLDGCTGGEVRHVLLHELGHHFGLTDKEMAA